MKIWYMYIVINLNLNHLCLYKRVITGLMIILTFDIISVMIIISDY